MSLTIRHILDISSCSQRHCCSSSLFTGLCNINISLACTTSTCHWVFNPHSLIKWDDDVIFCSRSLFTGLFEFSFHWVVRVLFSLGCSRSLFTGLFEFSFLWVVRVLFSLGCSRSLSNGLFEIFFTGLFKFSFQWVVRDLFHWVMQHQRFTGLWINILRSNGMT